MSSATSIERPDAGRRAGGLKSTNMPVGVDSAADAGFRPWHFFVLASLMAATFSVILSRQSTPEHLVLISVTIAAAGFAAAGFYRMLAPLVSDPGSAQSESLSNRERSVLEREKVLTLRSLKDCEFDRAMGKLSQKDFDEMSARLRARALSLMKQLDEGSSGYQAIIERELSARLAQRGSTSQPASRSEEAAPRGFSPPPPSRARARAEPRTIPTPYSASGAARSYEEPRVLHELCARSYNGSRRRAPAAQRPGHGDAQPA
jgi:hypothetical protein